MQMTPAQRDLLIRTIIGEAANEPFAGQQAVANVVLNRLNAGRYGKSLEDVIFAKSQFEPWATRRSELMAVPNDAASYRTADMAVEAALKSDPTAGATHFYSPSVMEGRGGAPAWAANMRANGTEMPIGRHIFGQADGKGTMREDRGTAYNSGYGRRPSGGLLDVPSGDVREDRGGAYNSGYGAAAPGNEPGLPAEPDWEALKALGDQLQQGAAMPEEKFEWLQPQVLKPTRQFTLGKGLLG